VLITSDGGRHWNGTAGSATYIVPLTSSEAWALNGQLDERFLWHTLDSGATWHPVARPGVAAIVELAGSGSNLLALTALGTWRSKDGGVSWQPFNSPIFASTGTFDARNPTVMTETPGLVVVQEGLTLRVSHDGGQTFTTVSLPSQDPNTFQAAVAFTDSSRGMAIVGSQQCVKTAAVNPSHFSLAVNGAGALLETDDGGLTWHQQSSLAWNILGLSVAGRLAVAVGSSGSCNPEQGISISTDGGQHWIDQALPISCTSVSVAAPSTIWLTCQTDKSFLLVSQDGARTWTQFNNPLGALFIATGTSQGWAYGPAGGLWHTTDNGRHWTAWQPAF
jgi:photosystem II stability/assembly factor-like uncharacterized protein